ncbi:MAG: NAD(P)H-binding protein [Bacteroidales bacterium]|nr:NAD(P)H-binding protein [Bacteroidales bacterium]
MIQKTAIVFGATGLTGKFLVQELINNDQYIKVKIINRTLQNYSNPKIEEIKIDYNNLAEYANEFKATNVFCCIGTTIKKAGSKEKFFAIDHDLPVEIANICSNNKCESFIAISSIGASDKSSNNYLKTKGLMETDILKLNFDFIAFVRPSMLLGPREEARFGEITGKIIMNLFGFLLFGKLKKYKAIHVKEVARAMINIANQSKVYSKNEKNVFESNELVKINKEQL